MPDEWNYKKAGLDLEKYAESMAGIQPLLARTWNTERLIPPPFPPRKGGKGTAGFASLYDLSGWRKPVLVTCTDGVGSKLKIASAMGRFDTVGIDLVAMSVNDLICTGGQPLVFLDYLAMPTDDPELTKQLVKGISEGCVEAGCSLSGGETAILPDFYAPGDFDMAGFAAGIVERDHIIDGRAISAGDVVIGIASSGVHSNGFSLVRKLVFEAAKLTVQDHVPELGSTVGDALLTPTRLYVKTIRDLIDSQVRVTGLANITGGGLPDNIARILPPDCKAVLNRGSWPVPPVFQWLQSLGNVADAEMDRVFNMGIGFVVICKLDSADQALKQLGDGACKIGEIVTGEAGVEFN